MFLEFGMQQGLRPGFTSSWAGVAPPDPADAAPNAAFDLAWGLGARTDPEGGTNGVLIPNGKRLLTIFGTINIKQPAGIEILVRFVSGLGDGSATSLWQSEQMSGAGSFPVPPLPLWLDDEDRNLQSETLDPANPWKRGLWCEWQAISRMATYTGDGNAFEIQIHAIATSKALLR